MSWFRNWLWVCLGFCLFSGVLQGLDLQLEHARTPQEIRWGLMGRRSLSENAGMLFHLPPPPQIRRFWMFNCFVDLDLAFLNEQGEILEIHTLKAYPEKMKELPPLRNLEDLNRVSPFHPVVRFFQRRAVESRVPVAYALEVPAGWFERNGVKVGDHFNLKN